MGQQGPRRIQAYRGPDGFRRRKPAPHYLNEALDALDALGAEGGLYVGDRATDVIAARRAGLDGVFLRRDHNAGLELDTEPVFEVESLRAVGALVGADGPVEPAGSSESGGAGGRSRVE